jgi:hypothetical protein
MLNAPRHADAAAPVATPPADVASFWRNAWRPTTAEDAYEITAIEGEIPRELYGTLYRNGPSQKILPTEGFEALHLFDGDGLVHAFRFEDGRVSYRGRFVECPTYLIEQEEGRACFAFVGLDVPDPSDRALLRQTHNTNVVYHGGKLMALVENAYPFEIDAHTLGPRGIAQVLEPGLPAVRIGPVDGLREAPVEGLGAQDPARLPVLGAAPGDDPAGGVLLARRPVALPGPVEGARQGRQPLGRLGLVRGRDGDHQHRLADGGQGADLAAAGEHRVVQVGGQVDGVVGRAQGGPLGRRPLRRRRGLRAHDATSRVDRSGRRSPRLSSTSVSSSVTVRR